MKQKAVISPKNKQELQRIIKLIDQYPIVGIVDMTGMPSTQLQKMRDTLRGSVIITLSKKTLIKLAINQSKKKDILKLLDYVKGMSALILTKESPFKLANILKKSKSKAAAKPGQTSPNDIKVSAGPTPFSPGPIIGELGALGIKTTIEGGKVAIKEDIVIVKEGQVIKAQVAGLLARLGIQPMEVGLNLTGVYENGLIYEKNVLEVDEKEFNDKLKLAATQAFNLAFNATYVTKENIELLIKKASMDATALADSQNIVTKENVGKLLAKAEAQAKSLNI